MLSEQLLTVLGTLRSHDPQPHDGNPSASSCVPYIPTLWKQRPGTLQELSNPQASSCPQSRAYIQDSRGDTTWPA